MIFRFPFSGLLRITFRSPVALCSLVATMGCGAAPTADGTQEFIQQTDQALTLSKFQGWRQVADGVTEVGPAVAARTSSNVDLFARGTDNQLYENFAFTTNQGASWTWSGWSSLGGNLLGKPSVTTWQGTKLAVVGRGTDQQIWVRTWVGSPSAPWTDWARISNGVFSRDAAIVYKFPSLYVFAPGTNDHVFWSSNDVTNGFNNNNWTAWTEITSPHSVTSEPAAAVDIKMYVTARGTDNHYYLTGTFDGSSWDDWSQIPGPTFDSGPALSSWSGHLDIFGAVSDSRQLWNSTSTNGGSTWGSTIQLTNSNLIASPSACSPVAGMVQVLATGTDNGIYWNPYKE